MYLGSSDDAVVRVLASHQCVPGSIPGPGIICGLSLVLVLFLASRGFSPGTPGFPSPQKPTFPNSNSIWKCQALYHEPLARVTAHALPVFDIKFPFPFTFTLSFFVTRILSFMWENQSSQASVVLLAFLVMFFFLSSIFNLRLFVQMANKRKQISKQLNATLS